MTNKSLNSKARAPFIFITMVIEAMGFGIIMPVLPDVIRKFITDETQVATTFGYFVAVYALLQFLFAPIMGRLSDKYGRRPVLLLSLLGTGIDYIFMALATSLPVLFIGRFISGFTGASYTVATAYIADISDDSNRSKNFGLIGAGLGVGFILGPALGGLVSDYGLAVPFLLSAGLNLLNFIFGFFFIPESLKPELRRDFEFKDLNPFKSLLILSSMSSIFLLVIAHVAIQLAGQTHPSIWAIYTETRYGWSAKEVGLSLGVVGVLHIVSQGLLTGYFVKWIGEKRVAKWGLLGEAFALAAFGLASSGTMVYVVLAISSIFGAAQPVLQSLISKDISADQQGELQGALMSLMSLAAVVNPLIMTRIFSATSQPGSTFYMPGSPYLLAGFFGLIAFIAVWRWEKSHNKLS
jgi:DHA1 family tetracycline resistance protein-like MFS transporter